MTDILLVIVIIILLVLIWQRYQQELSKAEEKPAVVVVSKTPATPASPVPAVQAGVVKKERFDPNYDRTFHQSILDVEMDKAKDEKGYTVDDYMLGKTLYRQHSNR